MELIVPFWFKQRQAKAEPAGDHTYRVTGPILPETFLRIRRGENGKWAAALSMSAEGPDTAATPAEFETEENAWEAAFELYRQHVIT